MEAVATTLPLFLLVFAAAHYLLEENHARQLLRGH